MIKSAFERQDEELKKRLQNIVKTGPRLELYVSLKNIKSAGSKLSNFIKGHED